MDLVEFDIMRDYDITKHEFVSWAYTETNQNVATIKKCFETRFGFSPSAIVKMSVGKNGDKNRNFWYKVGPIEIVKDSGNSDDNNQTEKTC